MRTADFDYVLPPERIAQTPLEPRDASRLLVLHRDGGAVEHRTFREIGEYLDPGDLLVLNDSRVLRARLRGRTEGGGAAEALLLRRLDPERWLALVRPGRRLREGRALHFGDEVEATVEAVGDGGERVLRFPARFDPESLGELPLPPYIRAPLSEPERYQTVYGRVPGSAAAPTAGLHFTPDLLARLGDAGVQTATITLHVGTGTFRPVAVDDPRGHPMHEEAYTLSEATVEAIGRRRAEGGRIVAVGTTAVRVLEHTAREAGDGPLRAGSGWTRLLILPGHRFRLVDALVTNFHLPRSTLLMLVSAFAGREHTLAAYAAAIRHEYRFYSFGDAMLIV